jgi:adenylate cyclase
VTQVDPDMAELIIRRADGDARFQLGDTVTIGRSLTCNVQLDDGYVSKVHSVITRRGSGFFIRDLKSANKTRVNGVVLEDEVPLRHGDQIIFGNTAAEFLDASAVPVAPNATLQPGPGALVPPPPPPQGPGVGTMAPTVENAPVPQGPTPAPAAAPVAAPSIAAAYAAAASSETSFETRVVAAVDQFQPERQLRSEDDLRRDYERLRVSYELSAALSGSLEFDALLLRIVDTLIRLFGADRGVVLLRDEAGVLRPRCSRTAAGTSTEVPYSNTIVNEALAARNSILSFDASVDVRFKAAESVLAQGIRSSMAAPMLRGDDALGVIVLDSSMRVGVFTEKDLKILQTAANQAAIALHNSMLAQQLVSEAAMRGRFERLVAPNLVERILSGALSVERAGVNRDVSILFSDIRGFTSFSETRRPEEIVSLLNDYFEDMVDIVFRNEGTLDKFVGDEIMALFGAPVGHADDARRAVQTSIEMQIGLIELNARWASRGVPPFQVGVGINTGEVTAGFIGSSKALSYTVIGDVVNTAARFCSNASAGEILVGASTYERVRAQFRFDELPALSVKNKAEPVHVFRVRY